MICLSADRLPHERWAIYTAVEIQAITLQEQARRQGVVVVRFVAARALELRNERLIRAARGALSFLPFVKQAVTRIGDAAKFVKPQGSGTMRESAPTSEGPLQW